jgi:hypothetical protein
LRGFGVVDAVLLAFLREGGLGVEAVEGVEDGLEVEGGEGTGGGKCAGFVTDLVSVRISLLFDLFSSFKMALGSGTEVLLATRSRDFHTEVIVLGALSTEMGGTI